VQTGWSSLQPNRFERAFLNSENVAAHQLSVADDGLWTSRCV
jgi:hypothetical protein